MLQGAVVAILVATVIGAMAYAGLGGPGASAAAWVFLLVGAALVAAFLAIAQFLRRWTPARKAPRPTGAQRGP